MLAPPVGVVPASAKEPAPAKEGISNFHFNGGGWWCLGACGEITDDVSSIYRCRSVACGPIPGCRGGPASTPPASTAVPVPWGCLGAQRHAETTALLPRLAIPALGGGLFAETQAAKAAITQSYIAPTLGPDIVF